VTTAVTTTCDICGKQRGSVITGGMTWQQAQDLAVGWYESISLDGKGIRKARRHFCTFDHLMQWLKKEAAA
jgi:hypothetical protein